MLDRQLGHYQVELGETTVCHKVSLRKQRQLLHHVGAKSFECKYQVLKGFCDVGSFNACFNCL